MSLPNDLSVEELTLLAELVAIPSPTGRVGEAAGWLIGQLRALGFRADLDQAGNVIATLEPECERPPGGDIYLLGHLDTVAGFWTPSLARGRLSGRGASDAKGPLAAFVAAALRALRLGLLRRRIWILAVPDEESDSAGARWLAATLPPPAYLVVGEPSGSGRVVLGYRGSLRCRLELSRPGQHSSRPGPTTAELGLRAWSQARRGMGALNGVGSRFGALGTHLLEIQSGSDGLRDWVRLELGLRIPVRLGPDEVLAQLRALVPGVRLEVITSVPAAVVPRTGALPTLFAKAIASEGDPVVWQHRLAGSDLNVVLPTWSCPAVVYGPGQAELDHTPRESIALPDYARGIRVLTRVLSAL
ncbi:MAG TPA: M20/M25/M40 family metallo-hydrolase [Candidatus Dormibacteraeota bacterium]|nr:M20/M25/M40 family metallo-hydrolase [Candidatus Dormibacteraeota bacterium]